jgi:mannosyl-3-phosphoglycerate phosphatase
MPAKIAPKLVIFSDLDGTFLDHESYAFDEALPAFRGCLSAGAPVVFCSSKTRAEMAPLLRELEVTDPFIPENGGAIFVPHGYFPFPVDFDFHFDTFGVIQLGAPYSALTSALDSLSHSLGIPVRAFHQMTASELAAETGLPACQAALAATREYDEPFTFRDAASTDVDRFLTAVRLRGLRWTKGGRFHHILGHAGKRPAVSILASLYRRWNPAVRIAGFGDSVNDTGMLAAVDLPILVQKPDGKYDRAVTRMLPNVQRSPRPGPSGWNVFVRHLLAETNRLPRQRRAFAVSARG